MMEQPLVSVLMTAYNRERYIAEAIESVLASTYANFELIIVDDGSGDRTVEIARSYTEDSRVRVYQNETNLGDYPNRNKAASYAQGKYLLYVDSDDTVYPHGITVMVWAMEKFPDAGFGLGSYPDDNAPFPLLLTPREIYLESCLKINHFDRAPGSGFIKRDVFLEVGGFSGKRMIGDYELWLKLSRYYSMVKYPAHLSWNRLHAGQESQSSYALTNYTTLKDSIFNENINHPDCPLLPEEIRMVSQSRSKKKKNQRLIMTLHKIQKLLNKL